jgi:hypothetical protein
MVDCSSTRSPYDRPWHLVKTLGTAVLGLEIMVLLLAIPVGLALSGRGAIVVWVFSGLALLAFVAAGLFRRDPRTAAKLGWMVQVLAIASGVLVPAMYLVGVMFAAVWWTAIHFGGKVDALESARRAQAG